MASPRAFPRNVLNRQLRFTTIVLSFAHGFVLESAAAQSRKENRARCKDSNPDLSITACSALIQSGEKTKLLLAVAFSNRGIGYAARQEYDHAIQDYDLALQLGPDFAMVYNNRGNAYGRKGEPDRAIDDYNQAIILKPNAMAFNNRGTAYYAKHMYDRAIQDYIQALRLNPDFAQALRNRDIAYAAKATTAVSRTSRAPSR